MSIQARPLVSPHQLEHDHSCLTSAMHARAQLLVSHPHCVNSSTTAYVTPPPHALGPNHSSPALHHVNSSPTTHVPPPPCQFKPDRSSATPTTSIRAQPLMTHLHHVLSSPITHLPPYCINLSATACVTSTKFSRAQSSLKIYFLITLFELVATLYRNDIAGKSTHTFLSVGLWHL